MMDTTIFQRREIYSKNSFFSVPFNWQKWISLAHISTRISSRISRLWIMCMCMCEKIEKSEDRNRPSAFSSRIKESKFSNFLLLIDFVFFSPFPQQNIVHSEKFIAFQLWVFFITPHFQLLVHFSYFLDFHCRWNENCNTPFFYSLSIRFLVWCRGSVFFFFFWEIHFDPITK